MPLSFAPYILFAHSLINACLYPVIYWFFNSTLIEHIRPSWQWWYKIYWLCSQDSEIHVRNITAYLPNLISYYSMKFPECSCHAFSFLKFLHILHPFHFPVSKLSCLKMPPILRSQVEVLIPLGNKLSRIRLLSCILQHPILLLVWWFWHFHNNLLKLLHM